jgi:pantetheine-phosphate adenylyltransferase
MENRKIAIYPGTFDPITLGHLDIIKRSSKIFDKVIVTAAVNPKKAPLFSADERMEMILDAIDDLSNVSVEKFDGLLVDFARNNNASVIVRGLRAISDFEYEFQMALMNRHMAEDITTVFLMPHEKFTYLNSTVIKNVANLGADIQKFTTKFVAGKLAEKFIRKG